MNPASNVEGIIRPDLMNVYKGMEVCIWRVM